MGDELAGDNGGSIRMFGKSIDEIFDGGGTKNNIVGIDSEKSFVVTNEGAGGSNRGAVAIGERGVLGDDGDFREVEDVLDGGVAIFLALGGELFANAVDAVVEIVFVDWFALGGGNDDDFLDSGLNTFFDDELHDGAIAEGEHGLRDGFGDGQIATGEASVCDNGLSRFSIVHKFSLRPHYSILFFL